MWLPAACERIVPVRFAALLLTLALPGPSVGALVCDWTCAAEYGAAAASGSNCHDTPGPAQTATFAAGQACHELTAPVASIVTCATPFVVAPAAVEVSPHEIARLQASSFATRRPDGSHAPPATHVVPLRI